VTDLQEQVLIFDGFAAEQSWCHLVLAQNRGVVLGELDDNPGTSLTNALELACAAVAVHFFNGRTDCPIFEWLPQDLRTRAPKMLEIKWHAGGFRLPEWVPPRKPPPFVRRAEDRIQTYVPYTAATLRAHKIGTVSFENAQEDLQELRKGLPPEPILPDRPPRR
jgi:hypothetical protein